MRELEKAGIPATIIGKATAGNDRVLLNEEELSLIHISMAASIEQQSSGGYSLVTGARALANGTQSLADRCV